MTMMEHWLTKVMLRHLEVGWQRLLVGWDLKTSMHLSVTSRLLANVEIAPTLSGASSSSVHTTVPPVLNGIVASPAQPACNFRPTLAHLSDHLLDQDALLRTDGIMVKIWLQVLMEPLPALFW